MNLKGRLLESYLSTFRNFHGGDSARIDVFDPFFRRLSPLGKSLGISMEETFSLLTSRLRHNNLTFISRIVNCLVLHTNAFTKILKWRNILYLSNLTKIIQHSSVLTKECKKKKKKNPITCPNRERVTFLIQDPNAMYKLILRARISVSTNTL